jgi:hypothetical protein
MGVKKFLHGITGADKKKKMKPTEEQIKEFWEWCGFRLVEPVPYDEIQTKGFWEAPTSHEASWGLPPIDLNNLFKWAVPKLSEFDFDGMTWWESTTGWVCELALQHDTDWVEGQGNDPALALFWAIWKVIKAK